MAKIRFKNDRLKSTIEKLKKGENPLKKTFKESDKKSAISNLTLNDTPTKTGYEGYHRDM